jgi:3-methylfumaryl-CoA hydratase
VTPVTTKVRHVVPLYCGRPITLAADPDPAGACWRLRAYDHRNVLAVEMEVNT